MILTFDADHVRKLLELSRSSERRRPNPLQTVTPDNWRRDLPEERKQALAASIEDGLGWAATIDDVDPKRLPAGLILVGDEGVYFLSNAGRDELEAAGVPHVCYARECDAATMPIEEYEAVKRASFGPDDDTQFMDAESLEEVLGMIEPGGHLELDVTQDRIGILRPPNAAPSPS